jgi:hypothetical protein
MDEDGPHPHHEGKRAERTHTDRRRRKGRWRSARLDPGEQQREGHPGEAHGEDPEYVKAPTRKACDVLGGASSSFANPNPSLLELLTIPNPFSPLVSLPAFANGCIGASALARRMSQNGIGKFDRRRLHSALTRSGHRQPAASEIAPLLTCHGYRRI